MIYSGKTPEKYLEYSPLWITEILSDSSKTTDQIIKKELYAQQGVKYYLIAEVVIYELKNGEYQVKPDERFDLTDHCSIELDMDEIMNS